MNMNRKTLNNFEGCLLGGAVGDALGAPVEFMSLEEITDRFGPEGIGEFIPAYGKIGAITDDTQMTLFTAEGLILSRTRKAVDPSADHVPLSVYHAYLRWLSTQDRSVANEMITQHGTCSMIDGILIGFRELHATRAPGNACLSSLKSGVMGTLQHPINNSKGCGGVMRIAPVGLVEPSDRVFDTACQIAAITHGHPTGYLAAGCLAQIIGEIMSGHDLLTATLAARRTLEDRKNHNECTRALVKAQDAWKHKPVSFETVASIGQGWVAEEALAIGVYCALVAGSDFQKGITLAVNHGGDSDSTG
ncbi:MAG: ADP-ribosylglycohydrolase family protein, partial [Deltaproteobacteria bacterium]|nr:ADP-ribosylglycohydrolase family protein [Deltaproteobacteria bacterium]